ncbi:hypothetical protein AB0M61_01665 [Streptomyces sp. NPDC051642]|uniref:hypothetical protein n=1 Tax=Streptomyces sp. NPDC051642 TaxID=3154646 RepID=UPI00342A1351
MTYFNLRKRAAEPDPEAVDEEEFDEADDEPDTVAVPPAGWADALRLGICGPGAWMTARFGITTSWTVHVVAAWAFFYYGAWVAAGIAAGWSLAVLAFVPREHLDRVTAAVERLHMRRPGTAPNGGDEPLVDPVVTLLWKLIGDAPGTHLKTLTAHLQEAAPEQPLNKAAVRAHLLALQIPVKPSVRDAAGRVNEGVHRDDLKAWQQALPSTVSGTPSEARSSPVATAVTCDVGKRRTVVATPLSALRRLLPRGGR